MGPRTTRRRLGRRFWLLAAAILTLAALPSEALARAGSGSSSFGRSMGRGYGGRGGYGGHHLFFFGGGGGGGLLLLVLVVVVLLFLASRRGGGRRRRL
jgi:hypothetical protein